MARPVTATILTRGHELARKARHLTGGANEAGLLVAKVVSRALAKFEGGASEETISQAMRRDLERMIEQFRRAPTSH